ncbi:MAG: hypothetical protein ACR2PM_20625 [Hyphomicrobiales bacterium]
MLALLFCAALGSTAVRADGIDGSLGFGTNNFPQPDPQRGVFGPPPGAGPGFDPDMFSMADQAIGFISSGVQDAIRKRLEVPKVASAAGAPQFGTSGIGFGTVSVGGWTQVFGLTQP